MERTNRKTVWYVALVGMIIGALFFSYLVTGFFFVVGLLYAKDFWAGIVVLFVFDIIYGFEFFRVLPVKGLLFGSGVVMYVITHLVKTRMLLD